MAPPAILDELRFPLRTAGFVGLTFGMYGLLEADTAISPGGSRDQVLHKWMRRYGHALLDLYGVEVTGGGPHVGAGDQYPERDGRGLGRLFVMNHRSALDIAVTLAFFEATIVSRADLARWPVIGVAARRVGTLFVDRSDRRSGSAVIQAMTEALERGRGVMVYPEGTTFADDEVRPFRAGAFTAARQAGAEIVPVGIAYGGGEASYVDEPFSAHMKRVSRARRTRAAIEVGAPMGVEGQEVDALLAAARVAVQALVGRARAALDGAA